MAQLFILTDNQGRRLSAPFPRREIRKKGLEIAGTAGAIMVFFVDTAGQILGYSSADTAAVNTAAVNKRKGGNK